MLDEPNFDLLKLSADHLPTKISAEEIARYAALYRCLRATLAAAEQRIKDALSPCYAARDRLRVLLLGALQEQGVDSMRIAGVGTVYRHRTVSVSAADKEAFKRWVLANQAWDMLEWRPLKTAVRDYYEATNSVPPGLNYSTAMDIGLRTDHDSKQVPTAHIPTTDKEDH